MSNPIPLTLTEPLDIGDAREAAKALARQRREAEANLEQAAIKAAETERDYRLALSQAYARMAGEGTAASREAAARAAVADKSYERDLAAGMVKVCIERLRGLEREGAALRSITEWSMKMVEREVPPATQTYGERAA